MRTAHVLIIIVLLAIIGFFAYMWRGNTQEVSNINNVPDSVTGVTETPNRDSIIGCYAALNGKDIYTLNINSLEGNSFSGALAFNNFEKDSSSGTYVGTYQNGILLGDYTFNSEGMLSVMQVIFKKSGNDFIRGYGDLNADGTRFTNLNNITYDPSPLSVFKIGACPKPTPTTILFPAGGEVLTAGNKYTLRWSGGADPTQIFLVDTSLKSEGASVSIADRVTNVRNTGSYEYTIPSTIKNGSYELQIGNSTSKVFTINK